MINNITIYFIMQRKTIWVYFIFNLFIVDNYIYIIHIYLHERYSVVRKIFMLIAWWKMHHSYVEMIHRTIHRKVFDHSTVLLWKGIIFCFVAMVLKIIVAGSLRKFVLSHYIRIYDARGTSPIENCKSTFLGTLKYLMLWVGVIGSEWGGWNVWEEDKLLLIHGVNLSGSR